jgi:type VI secretion system secreted protein VgrG
MDGSQAIMAGAALSVFSLDAQHDRLMRLDFPRSDGPDAILLPNRMTAHEEISRCFRFEVELLSDDARIPLKAMMARMVTISIVREDGSLRYFNGYVTEFRFLRADGGFAFYRMVLEPWLAFAKLRKDNVSFHGKSVIELTELTFAHYRQADWHAAIVGDYPRMTCANQYDETDYNHLHRRWEDLGLHYWYEHRADGHTLWLSDKSTLAQPIDPTDIDDSGEIPFRDKAGSLENDGIREWSPVRRIGSGQTTLASFDYKNPVAQRSTAESHNDQGDVFPYEIYENTGSYGFRTHDDGEKLAQQRMGERDANTQYFEAQGNDRTAQPGRCFKLGAHFSAELCVPKPGEPAKPSIGDRDYLILSVDHEASNNYQAGPGAPSNYENTFRCVRKDIQWRPGHHYNSRPCTYPGIQTAIVVGHAGSEIHTDGYGRVKVQFHWDRLGNYDENSSPWLRVMSPGAGSEFGNIRLPRVGEEVAVVYLDANIDHPVILGALYNQTHMPPWQLPEQQALSGLRSRELQAANGDGRGNHLVLDDTAGKIQAQLKSDHQCSQLSLGNICRIENNAGREDLRGEGWELRTDGHGVARAGKGMLITTEARPDARGTIKDLIETSHRLATAGKEHQSLAELAKQNGVQEPDDNQTDIASELQKQSEAITGTKGSGSFPELSQPHLVLASPAGIATTTAGNTHITSDHHTSITTGKSFSLAAGLNLFASVRQAIRLFVENAGLRMVAAAGDIDVQALSNSIKLLAKLDIVQSANRITITAKEELVINGGGSYVKFAAGSIELGTSGSFTAHAATHSFLSAKSMSANATIAAARHGSSISSEQTLHELIESDSWVEFKLVDQNGPLKGERYVLTDPSGKKITGKVDKDGAAHIEKIAAGRCKVEFPDLGYSMEVSSG